MRIDRTTARGFSRPALRLLAALAVACALPGAPRAEENTTDAAVEGHVITVSDDHLRIDIGRDAGLVGGDVGSVVRDGEQVAVTEVVWVDIGFTELRILNRTSDPRTGDRVLFDRTGRASQSAQPPSQTRAGPLAAATTQEAFVPLLAPPEMKKTALAREADIFHGTLRAREVYQLDSPSQGWYSASRLDSNGSVERIGGAPWSFVWSGNASERTGSVPSSADDYRRIQPHAYVLMLSEKFDSGFLRLGRFLPNELPSIGTTDGAQAERTLSPSLSVGAAAGLRPDRLNQGFSDRESIGAAYATVQLGQRGGAYYSGTLGGFQTVYRGEHDETALLWDQRAEFGPKLSINASAQEDFDTGAAVVDKTPRLVRGDASLNSVLTAHISAHGGASHYEPVDTWAQRDLMNSATGYLNNGYWRYYGGLSETLPWKLRADEDLSTTYTSQNFATSLWRLGLSRQGLPGLPEGSVHATAYNLYNPAGRDYGGTLSVDTPLFAEKLSLDANLGAHWGPTSSSPRALWLSDFGLHAVWRVSRAWTAELGASRFYQAPIISSTYSGSVGYRW